MSDVVNMNKKELLSLPDRDWETESVYDSLILVPTGEKHDSGWSIIAIIGVIRGKGAVEVATRCTDDICWNLSQTRNSFGIDMRTDCLFPAGLMHVWGSNIEFVVGQALSSTTVTVRDCSAISKAKGESNDDG